MPTLFFDTETTGKWDFSLDHTNQNQPELIQIGAILRDDNGIIRAEIDAIVYTEEKISEGAYEKHGISSELSEKTGISLKAASLVFEDLIHISDRIVGHNVDFDIKIMKRALWKSGFDHTVFEEKEKICTMKSSTDVCRLPSTTKKKGFKWPTLNEAYHYFTNQNIENAHNAMVDVRACIVIYDGLKALNIIKE
jgi:DNA polymerase-3 subunit epsilon